MRRKINITFIIPSLRIGGTQKFLLNLIENINFKQFNISLIILENIELGLKIKNPNIKTYYLGVKRVRFSLIKLCKAIKKTKPEIVFSLQSHLSILVILLKPFFKRVIFIARESNIVSKKNKDFKNSFSRNIIYKILMKKFHKIICQSEDMKEDLLSNFSIPKNNLVKINNPVDINKVINLSQKPEEINYDYDFIILASTLSPQKGITRMIDSLLLIEDNINFNIVILGDGKSRSLIEDKIKENKLQNQIKIVGLKENPYPWIKKSKVLLLPSYFEGFPNVVLEAAVLKKPTISFNIKGGINEIILNKKNGFIANNNKEYADYMQKSLSFPFDKNYIYDNIKLRFSIKKILEEYETMFKSALNENI